MNTEHSSTNPDGPPDGRPSQPLSVGPALNRDDLVGAFRLVYDNYLRAGYCGHNPTGMRVSPFVLLPGAVTFVARKNASVVSTVSLIPDGPFGLPVDGVFGDAARALRLKERSLAEVAMLADRRAFLGSAERLGFLLKLFKLVFDYSRRVLRARELCITVHPRHAPFYERYLLFRRAGEPRPCAAVNGNPATFLSLDLAHVAPGQLRDPQLRTHFFGHETPLDVLTSHYCPNLSDVEYLLDACPASSGPAEELRTRLAELCTPTRLAGADRAAMTESADDEP